MTETRSIPAKASGKKQGGNASGSDKRGSGKTQTTQTRNTKRHSDLVQIGNKPGRMIVIEKQPKDGAALDPGSFIGEEHPKDW